MLWGLTAVALAGSGAWPEGTTLYVGASGEVYDVTGGGAATRQTFIVDLDRYNVGQVAFTRDRQLALVPSFSLDEVVGVAPDGTISIFATHVTGPTGLLRTHDGRILAAQFHDGTLLDITDGGDFTYAVPLNTGLFAPRSLAQGSDGTVYVADQMVGGVYVADLDGGPVSLFATGLPTVRAIAWHDGALYAAAEERIVDITAGGDQTAAIPFALGAAFFSLARTGDGRLISGALLGTALWDVTPGGVIPLDATWATALPSGDTTIGTAPPDPSPPEATGETGTDTGVPAVPTDSGSPPVASGDTGAVTGPDEASTGCGCASGPAGGLAGLVLVPWLWRRRASRQPAIPMTRRWEVGSGRA